MSVPLPNIRCGVEEARAEMGFFDFLAHNRYCAAEPHSVVQLNLRHHMIVEPLLPLFKGRSVLDLGARDGRWAYAFAKAGARCVTALEEEIALVRRFESFPEDSAKSCIKMKCTDIFGGLEHELTLQNDYEIVTVMGSFHGILDHLRLLCLLQKFAPKVIIIDSAFALSTDPVITLFDSEDIKDMDALADDRARRSSLIGLPSRAALKTMARSVGYQCDWIDWGKLGLDDRQPVSEYFRDDGRRRFTCLMHTL